MISSQVFSKFGPDLISQSAAQDFYELLDRLRRAVASQSYEWATYPTFVDYARICFWAIRKLEYSFIAQAFVDFEAKADRSLKILDVGSGVVPLCNWMSRRGHRVIALDPYVADIRCLVQNDLNSFYGSKVSYAVARGEQLPFSDGAFDVVTFVSVLEHIPPGRDRLTVWELARVLRPRGNLLMTFDIAPYTESGVNDHLRQPAQPFTPENTRHLLKQISPAFDVSPSDLPSAFDMLTWTDVNEFWTAAQMHDGPRDPIRPYLAMGAVLQRSDMPFSPSTGEVAAAFLQGQALLEKRMAEVQYHADRRLAQLEESHAYGQALEEELRRTRPTSLYYWLAVRGSALWRESVAVLRRFANKFRG